MSIYTKQGDAGISSTIISGRIPKNSPVFAVLGTLDELTSQLGLVKHHVTSHTADIVERVQIDIMGVCGELAGADIYITEDKIATLERSIDIIFSQLQQVKLFVMPGKTLGGATLDVARTIARRTEREMVTYSRQSPISPDTIKWMNRISDFLFALARVCDMIEVGPLLKPNDNFSDMATMLCDKVVTKAREMNIAAVVAVCDDGGNLMCMKRDDSSYIASIDVAINKAYTAVSLQMSTQTLGELAKPDAPFYGIQHSNNKLIIFGGGVTLEHQDSIIGGLGVSGGTAEQDTMLAEYGKSLMKGAL